METTTTPVRSNYQIYRDSPYFREIESRWGRFLYPAQVRAVLAEHSVTEDEYLSDPYVALGALPDHTDAANLLAFLGY